MNIKNVTVKARMSEELKRSVEEKLDKLGLSPSDVIRMLYAKIDLYNAIPFDLTIPCNIPHIPNTETIEVLEKSMRGEDLINVGDIEGLKRELGINC